MAKHILPASVAAVGTAALVWNTLSGMLAYQSVAITQGDLAAMTYAQQQAHLMTPQWANWALVVAVASGVVGSMGLIKGRSWAAFWFLVSAVSVLMQLFGTYVAAPVWQVNGLNGMVFPVLLLAVCAFLWSYTHRARARGWLQ